MDAGGPAGLGISFDTRLQHHSPIDEHHQHSYGQHRYYEQRLHNGYEHPAPPHQHLSHLRPLRESMSYDAGLRERAQAQAGQPYLPRHAHDLHQKHVRIADGTPEVLNGKGGYLPYDLNHLSPLSDFDHSTPSDSASGSSRPFSPASLSSLPSSTESGAHPTYAHMPAPCGYPIQHEQHHDAPAYPISHAKRSSSSREHHSRLRQGSMARPSRLPAFLAERKELGRPYSMVDLRGQAQRAHEVYGRRGPDSSQPQQRLVSTDFIGSPAESVPSSAAALQRERFQGGAEDQASARLPMRQSEGRPRRRRNSDEQTSPLRNRSRSLSAFELRMLAKSEAARSPAALTAEASDEEFTQPESPSPPGSGTVISIAPPVEASSKTPLKRQLTLLTAGASTVRRKKELDRLLMPSTRFGAFGEGPTASSRSSKGPDTSATSSPAVLEQAKSSSHARVELDLMLETPLVVEGGWLKGKLEVRARRPRDREGELWLSKPKLRVIGFEGESIRTDSREALADRVHDPCRARVRRGTLHFLPPRLLRRHVRQSFGTSDSASLLRVGCR